jgi:hypothetical protein
VGGVGGDTEYDKSWRKLRIARSMVKYVDVMVLFFMIFSFPHVGFAESVAVEVHELVNYETGKTIGEFESFN